MNSITTILGILLIIIGISGLAYEGITYTKQEPIAQIGNVQVTENTQKTIYFSPLLGGLALAAGLILVVTGRRK